MIDNIEEIRKMLSFDTLDDFYHLQIIKRKKEHKELGSNSYVVKTYYVSSHEYLDIRYGEIKALCDFHNARACINLNKRSFEKLAFQMLKKVTDQILNKDYRSVRKAYESVCGAHSNETDKKWIVDIDVKDNLAVKIICNDINNCEPGRRSNKILAILPTKNGFHAISSPFNMEEFKRFHPTIEVHKNNPTILYIS